MIREYLSLWVAMGWVWSAVICARVWERAEYREKVCVDRELGHLRERAGYSHHPPKVPMERRYFNEGCSEYLKIHINNIGGVSPTGMQFIKTNVYKDRKLNRYSSDLLLVQYPYSLSLYDLSGELVHSLQTEYPIDMVTQPSEAKDSNRQSLSFYIMSNRDGQREIREGLISMKKAESRLLLI